MSLLEELYSEDLIGDPETLGEGEERGEPLFLEDEAPEQNDGDAENEHILQTVPQSDNPVQPKKKRVKNPQPKLDAQRLKGPRGLTALESIFKDYKFCGKGYEKRDLDQVMKRLEHWAHRLFPKYEFDDCLEKLETLGHKKAVMVYVKKIRMGLETAESETVEPITEDNDDLALPLDPFDELLSQQISEAQASTNGRMPSQSIASSQCSIPSSPQHTKIVLTDEQRERMERNRLIAQERRLLRLKALEKSKEQNEENPTTEIAETREKRNDETQVCEGQQEPATERESVSNEGNVSQSEAVPVSNQGNVFQTEVLPVSNEGNVSLSEAVSVSNEGNVLQSQIVCVSNGTMSQAKEVPFSDEGNVSKTEAAPVLNEGNVSQSEIASVSNEGNMSQAKAVPFSDEGNVSKTVAAPVLSEGNVSQSHAVSVSNEGNVSQSHAVSVSSEGNVSQLEAVPVSNEGNVSKIEAVPILN